MDIRRTYSLCRVSKHDWMNFNFTSVNTISNTFNTDGYNPHVECKCILQVCTDACANVDFN